MAVMVCLKISSFSLLLVDFLIRSVSTPGVSMIEATPSRMLNYFLSRVVPRCLSTIAIRSPMRQLKRLLFPQLGSPTSETRYFPISSFRLVFHGFYISALTPNLVFFLLIIFSICSGVCRISCEFFALRENSYFCR